MNLINVFAYGTLQFKNSQIEVLKRELKGEIDSISGWKVLNDVDISGFKYPRLVTEESGIVFGHIYKLTIEEIDLLDKWETSTYERETIMTNNKNIAFVYLAK